MIDVLVRGGNVKSKEIIMIASEETSCQLRRSVCLCYSREVHVICALTF